MLTSFSLGGVFSSIDVLMHVCCRSAAAVKHKNDKMRLLKARAAFPTWTSGNVVTRSFMIDS